MANPAMRPAWANTKNTDASSAQAATHWVRVSMASEVGYWATARHQVQASRT